MTDKIGIDQEDAWRGVANSINISLPNIDAVLSEANVPLKSRLSQAVHLYVETCIEMKEEHWKPFMLSEAYARILALITDWYRTRYGAAFQNARLIFPAAVEIFGSPFPLNVPVEFSTPGEEPGTIWVGSPDNIQPEENPLHWIEEGPNLEALADMEREALRERAAIVANAIRGIQYELNLLRYHSDEPSAELAASLGANLKVAAGDLCSHDNGRLRNAGWEVCHATEKALKLAILRSGGKPEFHHKLPELAAQIEQISSLRVDKALLMVIPSGRQAVQMRYGSAYTVSEGMKAYNAALRLIKSTLLAVTPQTKYNTRNLRLLLKTPPWFEYETDSFIRAVKAERT